jgi:hypothetical protein
MPNSPGNELPAPNHPARSAGVAKAVKLEPPGDIQVKARTASNVAKESSITN